MLASSRVLGLNGYITLKYGKAAGARCVAPTGGRYSKCGMVYRNVGCRERSCPFRGLSIYVHNGFGYKVRQRRPEGWPPYCAMNKNRIEARITASIIRTQKNKDAPRNDIRGAPLIYSNIISIRLKFFAEAFFQKGWKNPP